MRAPEGVFLNQEALHEVGLNCDMLRDALTQTYRLLDTTDAALISEGAFPLCETVELANLSSMIGNIFGGAVARQSKGLLCRNGPHKYPDLLTTGENTLVPNIEIKMALERNAPKGHHAKEGYYFVARYVLCEDGKAKWDKADRGTEASVWEIRFGYLKNDHFNISNTAGDSGKTAVVNKAGMDALKVVYLDLDRAPMSPTSRTFKNYQTLAFAKMVNEIISV